MKILEKSVDGQVPCYSTSTKANLKLKLFLEELSVQEVL